MSVLLHIPIEHTFKYQTLDSLSISPVKGGRRGDSVLRPLFAFCARTVSLLWVKARAEPPQAKVGPPSISQLPTDFRRGLSPLRRGPARYPSAGLRRTSSYHAQALTVWLHLSPAVVHAYAFCPTVHCSIPWAIDKSKIAKQKRAL